MTLQSGSAILTALYHQNPEEARRLAQQAEELTVWEAAALGDDEHLRDVLSRDPAQANAYAADGHTPSAWPRSSRRRPRSGCCWTAARTSTPPRATA
jgi:hypothetical protein